MVGNGLDYQQTSEILRQLMPKNRLIEKRDILVNGTFIYYVNDLGGGGGGVSGKLDKTTAEKPYKCLTKGDGLKIAYEGKLLIKLLTNIAIISPHITIFYQPFIVILKKLGLSYETFLPQILHTGTFSYSI